MPNVPDSKIGELTEEPVLQELRYDPSEVMRGLVSCTGMDYCHFALIDTKGWALKTARALEAKLGKTQPLRMHWSGCPASCGNHTVADIGLLGKNIKINGEVVEAVDVSPAARPARDKFSGENYGRCSLRRLARRDRRVGRSTALSKRCASNCEKFLNLRRLVLGPVAER